MTMVVYGVDRGVDLPLTMGFPKNPQKNPQKTPKKPPENLRKIPRNPIYRYIPGLFPV